MVCNVSGKVLNRCAYKRGAVARRLVTMTMVTLVRFEARGEACRRRGARRRRGWGERR